MDELIARVSASLGVDAELAKTAIGHVLAFLHKELPEGPVAEFIEKVPGARDLVDHAAIARAAHRIHREGYRLAHRDAAEPLVLVDLSDHAQLRRVHHRDDRRRGHDARADLVVGREGVASFKQLGLM